MALNRNAVDRVESVNERGNHVELAAIPEPLGELGVRNGHIVDKPGGLLVTSAGEDVILGGHTVTFMETEKFRRIIRRVGVEQIP